MGKGRLLENTADLNVLKSLQRFATGGSCDRIDDFSYMTEGKTM